MTETDASQPGASYRRTPASTRKSPPDSPGRMRCCACSSDLERLQRAYFEELRSIVARSEPAQHVVLANLQLFALTVAAT